MSGNHLDRRTQEGTMLRAIKGIVSAILVMWAGVASAATYQLTADPYISLVPPTPNPFTSSMQITGTFVVPTPLAANLNMADISSQITSYTFTDGVHTFTQANSAFNAPLNNGSGFLVSTDASGNVTYAQFLVMTPVPPHGVGGLLNYIAIGDGAGGYDQMTCVAVQGTPATCSQVSFEGPAARAFSSRFVLTAIPDVPVMPTWGFVLLAVFAGWLGARALRQRNRPARTGQA
jgi:hypothetical protein